MSKKPNLQKQISSSRRKMNETNIIFVLFCSTTIKYTGFVYLNNNKVLFGRGFVGTFQRLTGKIYEDFPVY